MSKSNWSGGSGWKAINDPTGLLTGRVLVATAGQSQYVEDYLLQLVGTTTAFTAQHYASVMNYAFPTYVESSTFSGASLGLVSRASALSTTTPITAHSCYIGRISPKDNVAEIVKRVNNVDEVIATSILPSSTWAFGTLHTMRLNTFGTSPVTLEFLVNDETLVSVGDSSTSALTTGYGGIQMQGGTAYCDNYTILQYTSSGGGTYSGIYPNQFYDTAVGTTSTFMLLWLRGDAGVNTTLVGSTTFVDSWDDQADYLSSSYQLTQTGANRPEIQDGTTLNGIQYMRFNRAKSNYLIGALNSGLDVQGSAFNNGVAIFAVVKFWDENGIIGDPQNSTSGANYSQAPLGNYGRSYQFRGLNSVNGDVTFQQTLQYDNNSASSESNGGFGLQSWGIMNFIAFGTVTNRSSVYLNGTLVSTTTSQATTNFDMSDVGRVFHLGRRQFNASTSGYLHGSYDMIEYILVQVGSDGLTDTIRQKTEGYLAWKYDLVSLLPSSHPYKSAPPAS